MCKKMLYLIINLWVLLTKLPTLIRYRIDVEQGINSNVGPGKFIKKNKCRA